MEKAQTTTYIEGNNHLLDYWEEYQKMMEETKLLDDYLEEECPRNYDGTYILLRMLVASENKNYYKAL